jgi:hypothetical protein
MLRKIGHSFTLIESTKASRCQGAPILCRSDAVFGVRVAAVVQHKIVLVEPEFAQSAKLEVQKRLWPGCGSQQRRRRKWSDGQI